MCKGNFEFFQYFHLFLNDVTVVSVFLKKAAFIISLEKLQSWTKCLRQTVVFM